MKRMPKRLFLLVTVPILLLLFTVYSAAVTTPWIDLPSDEETMEESATGSEQEETPAEEPGEENPGNETPAIDMGEENGNRTPGTTVQPENTERPAAAPRKKGCGSIIPQSGVGIIFILGITELFFVKRKEQRNESAN